MPEDDGDGHSQPVDDHGHPHHSLIICVHPRPSVGSLPLFRVDPTPYPSRFSRPAGSLPHPGNPLLVAPSTLKPVCSTSFPFVRRAHSWDSWFRNSTLPGRSTHAGGGGWREMADREGFEPSVLFPVHTLSRRAHSTALAPVLSARPERRGVARSLGVRRGATRRKTHSVRRNRRGRKGKCRGAAAATKWRSNGGQTASQ